MERMDAKMDEIINSPPPAEKEPTSVIDVQFSMYCHNARCIMLGVTQERFGAVNTDTGHGQADDEECDECGEAMYYYPYDRSR